MMVSQWRCYECYSQHADWETPAEKTGAEASSVRIRRSEGSDRPGDERSEHRDTAADCRLGSGSRLLIGVAGSETAAPTSAYRHAGGMLQRADGDMRIRQWFGNII